MRMPLVGRMDAELNLLIRKSLSTVDIMGHKLNNHHGINGSFDNNKS